ncbi:MAG: thioredoxin domain-containing protein [Deltaproteobacteria bacterium]|jgi:protein-disulfide isomerase|nr:thioredoxin domain-containing protein [Deltaproteobacteria bacterium]
MTIKKSLCPKKLCSCLPALLFFVLACLVPAPLEAAQENNAVQADLAKQAELRNALRTLLREDPNLVLDVLRENSETVLDIAQQGSEQRKFRILVAQWMDDMKVPKQVLLADRPTKGPAKAPVTIVVFTDFTCLYCQQGEKLLDKIYNAYPGKLRIVYKSLPMSAHPGSVEAAEFMLAAWMQNKETSWKLFVDFFENRDLIVGKSGDAYLRSAASARGFNMQKLVSDSKSAAVRKLLQEDEQDAEKLKVQGTPFFLVNNIVIRGALQENLFREAVNMALGAVR